MVNWNINEDSDNSQTNLELRLYNVWKTRDKLTIPAIKPPAPTNFN